jgi:hypothetical protein
MLRRNGFYALLVLAAVSGCDDGDSSLFGGSGSSGSGGTSGGQGGGGGATASSSATTSSSSTASSTGSGQTCANLGDPCTTCEATQCADIYCNCYGNPQCGMLYECLLPCAANDVACQQACWTAHEAGISDGALLVHCAATVCAASCPGFAPITPCQECLFGECETQMNTCLANPDCVSLLACLDACTMPGCENGCYAMYPGGLGDAGPVGDCLQASCAPACQ